jgi:predicted MPP superfamily phosphohydrolase
MAKKQRVLVFGDLHFPYQHKKALAWALKQVKTLNPTHVVQIGDLYDFYYSSTYAKKDLKFSATEEVQKGREAAREFWAAVQKAAPKAKCVQLLGNHDDRPLKRVMEKVPELSAFFNVRSLFEFASVTTQANSRTEYYIPINGSKVLFHHGYLTGLGKHMHYNEQNCVVGHSHKGGTLFKGYGSGIRWELNVGFLGDETQGPLQYGPQSRKFWTLGFGVVDEHGPRFVPYKGK